MGTETNPTKTKSGAEDSRSEGSISCCGSWEVMTPGCGGGWRVWGKNFKWGHPCRQLTANKNTEAAQPR